MTMRIGFLVSHPIQYYTPIFRELAKRCDLTVFFAHRQTAAGQAKAGYGVAFEWDVDLLSGYQSRFLTNVARQPSTDAFSGCDTPGIAAGDRARTLRRLRGARLGLGPTCRQCAPAGGRRCRCWCAAIPSLPASAAAPFGSPRR